MTKEEKYYKAVEIFRDQVYHAIIDEEKLEKEVQLLEDYNTVLEATKITFLPSKDLAKETSDLFCEKGSYFEGRTDGVASSMKKLEGKISIGIELIDSLIEQNTAMIETINNNIASITARKTYWTNIANNYKMAAGVIAGPALTKGRF